MSEAAIDNSSVREEGRVGTKPVLERSLRVPCTCAVTSMSEGTINRVANSMSISISSCKKDIALVSSSVRSYQIDIMKSCL